MNERDAFLRAIAANEGDSFIRLVYADWLEEHDEYEEAERQRKWPDAKKRLDDICRKVKEAYQYGDGVTCDQLLEFGRRVSATDDGEVVFSVDDEDGIPKGRPVAEAIRDQIPEFWDAWSVITGLPVPQSVADKAYIQAAWECCAHESYPERHLAGPKPERYIQAEEAEAEAKREEERQQQRDWEAKYDLIQDDLEQDRP